MIFVSLDVDGQPLRAGTDLVLHHEHLACDITCWVEPSDDPATTAPVREAILADVRARPWSYPDNLRLDDVDLVCDEIGKIPAQAPAIIDVTPVDIGRSPETLRTIATLTNAQVFMGCGRYVESARSGEEVREPGAYRDEIMRDLLEGTGGVKAAVIGEIGTSNPITRLEEASLRGASQAQAETGAPLLIHVDLWNPAALEALEIVESEQGDVAHTVVCHLDCSLLVRELGYFLEILMRGALIAFDTWGDELEYAGNQQPTDEQRIDALLALADHGYGQQLLHSHDICTKTQLTRYGGSGYRHLPFTIWGRLRDRGLSDRDIEELLVSPARRLLGAGAATGNAK